MRWSGYCDLQKCLAVHSAEEEPGAYVSQHADDATNGLALPRLESLCMTSITRFQNCLNRSSLGISLNSKVAT